MDIWASLTDIQQTIIIVGAVGVLWGVLWSYVRYGTDYSGVGAWIKGWLQ